MNISVVPPPASTGSLMERLQVPSEAWTEKLYWDPHWRPSMVQVGSELLLQNSMSPASFSAEAEYPTTSPTGVQESTAD